MTTIIGRFVCTENQQQTYDRTKIEAEQLFKRLTALANEVHNVVDEPGAMNGARLHLTALRDSLFFAAQALSLEFDGPNRGRDYFPYMVIRNHKARGSMGLPGWMQRLLDKHDGTPPETWTNADITRDGDSQ